MAELSPPPGFRRLSLIARVLARPYTGSPSSSGTPRRRAEVRGARSGGVPLWLKAKSPRLEEVPPTAPRGRLRREPLALLAERYVVKERPIVIAGTATLLPCIGPRRHTLTVLLFAKRPAHLL